MRRQLAPSEMAPPGTHFTRAENVPKGYCHCGCGGKTSIYPKAYVKRGIKKGDHAKFLQGHAGRRGKESVPLSGRFWNLVATGDPQECWEWQGGRFPSGYGRVMERKTPFLAHRFAYSSANGEIPDGLVVRHSCDNPPCCNPNHLLLGTHKDNMGDALERGRTARGERSGSAVLTDGEVKELRRRRSGGESISQLAREKKMSRAAIRQAIKGETWSHVN